MRNQSWLSFSLIAAAVLLGSCSHPEPVDTPGGGYVRPAGTGPQTVDGANFAYVATPDREHQIRAGYSALKIGQSREEVRTLMGPPDLPFARYTRSDEGHHYLGWGYIYTIRATQFKMSTSDVEILLVFDPSTDQLRWASPTESAKLPTLGTPGKPR